MRLPVAPTGDKVTQDLALAGGEGVRDCAPVCGRPRRVGVLRFRGRGEPELGRGEVVHGVVVDVEHVVDLVAAAAEAFVEGGAFEEVAEAFCEAPQDVAVGGVARAPADAVVGVEEPDDAAGGRDRRDDVGLGTQRADDVPRESDCHSTIVLQLTGAAFAKPGIVGP